MATRLDFTTADLINCQICIREFDTDTRKPKVLHCGHTVCEDCTFQLREPSGLNAIRCPVCRQFTVRPTPQAFVTNYQIMGFLAAKEKQERERNERGEKAKVVEERVQFRMGRSKNLKIHVASKKDLEKPEMFVRKDGEGSTSIVLVGKTGSPEEIIKYIEDNGVELESGLIGTRIVYDGGRGNQADRFTKVNVMGAGQSALKCTTPPEKLEDATVTASYELKATEESGELRLELVRSGELPTGFQVFGGAMTKPSAKRLRELQSGSSGTNDKNTPSTSAVAAPPIVVLDDEPVAPVAKRTRRARGK